MTTATGRLVREHTLLVALSFLVCAGCATVPTPQPEDVAKPVYLHVECSGTTAADPMLFVKDPADFAYRTPARTVTYYSAGGDGVIDTIHVDDGHGVEEMYLRVGNVLCQVTPRVCLATKEVFPIMLYESADLTREWLARRRAGAGEPRLADETRLREKLAGIFTYAR